MTRFSKPILVNDMMLEIDNIYASYGEFDVLQGVSLGINEKEIVCLIGPNGAGKSTVFRTIFGFLKPRLGKVYFKGEDITGFYPTKILQRGISYVLQRHSVFPRMTVRENLDVGAFIRRDKEQVEREITNLYELFPILKEKKNDLAMTLSGGQRRMLEIARVLLTDPQLLMLDEPTLGLAPKVVTSLFDKITEIHEATGIPVMIVEQNAKKALDISDRAYVLELGKICMEGPAIEISNDPECRRLYLGDVNA